MKFCLPPGAMIVAFTIGSCTSRTFDDVSLVSGKSVGLLTNTVLSLYITVVGRKIDIRVYRRFEALANLYMAPSAQL